MTIEELRALVAKAENLSRKAPDDFETAAGAADRWWMRDMYDVFCAEEEAVLATLPPEVAERLRLTSRGQEAVVALIDALDEWEAIIRNKQLSTDR